MPEQAAGAKAKDSDQRTRSTDLENRLIALVDHPEAWLSTPSVHFGGRKPAQPDRH